jgi:hypothetical protein
VVDWIWANKESINGLTLLPHDGGTHKQAPHEEISKGKYEEMYKSLSDFNIDEVFETEDATSLNLELACSGGSCDIK